MSNTQTTVADHRSWNESICRTLIRRAGSELSVELHGSDLVGLLEDLDVLLEGGPPAAVVFDELDVLVLPEQGSQGRRTAGRLGSLALHNVAMIGAVQGFHRSSDEFKTWQSIECPADLTWEDGVTYFFGRLTDTIRGALESSGLLVAD